MYAVCGKCIQLNVENENCSSGYLCMHHRIRRDIGTAACNNFSPKEKHLGVKFTLFKDGTAIINAIKAQQQIDASLAV